MKRLLRPDEVASRLNVSKRSVYRLIGEGHFSACRIGGCLRVFSDSVDDYIRRQVELYALENGLSDSVPDVT